MKMHQTLIRDAASGKAELYIVDLLQKRCTFFILHGVNVEQDRYLNSLCRYAAKAVLSISSPLQFVRFKCKMMIMLPNANWIVHCVAPPLALKLKNASLPSFFSYMNVTAF